MTMEAVFPNKTANFFYKLCVVVFLSGMPNLWIEDLYMSKRFVKNYRTLSHILGVFVYLFMVIQMGAFLTDQNLSEKQEMDLISYAISHPLLWSYTVILSSQTSKIKKILNDILEMKKVFNDVEVEERMVKKSKLYTSALTFSCMLSMTMYTFDAFMQVITKGTTFTTVITAWPYIENNSTLANLARVVWNISWWVLIIRALGTYAFVFSLTTSLSHQFLDLQKYFYSLDDIFDKAPLEQREMEIKYEEAFKVGIHLFNDTMLCVNQSKNICGSVFSGQIVFNMILIVILLTQLQKSPSTLLSVGAIALSASSVLIGTGLIMCNAGEVTVEASHLATAMYASGWQNCQGRSSYKIRTLVVYSMMVAQKPVVILGLGIIELSYKSYVSLVKSTYSVFSLFV